MRSLGLPFVEGKTLGSSPSEGVQQEPDIPETSFPGLPQHWLALYVSFISPQVVASTAQTERSNTRGDEETRILAPNGFKEDRAAEGLKGEIA
jgi:hypothetical protein